MKHKDARTATFTADARYLLFPRSRGEEGVDHVLVEIDGEPWFSVHTALLASADPAFFAHLDVSDFRGLTITVTLEGPNAAGIDLVRMGDEIPGPWPLYREPGRPLVHFSPLRGWLNDPSGMIWLDGAWHLYFANTRLANHMAGPDNAWGHAVSRDLVHWEEKPLFLCPVRGRHSFWTGGAAVDAADTTGLGRPGAPALVFSANNGSDAPNAFTQCIFPSVDGGASAVVDGRYLYKPLPAQPGRRGGSTRDPMILWWEPGRTWVMIVYNQPPEGPHSFHFFQSRDLQEWTETSVLEGMFECPNLFALPVDGEPRDTRWVIWGSSTEYLLGSFDGARFTPDGRGLLRTHFGAFSASQVFANVPGGRIVQVGWAHCCNLDGEFSQMASFPLDLSLAGTDDGVRLRARFVPELASLRGEGWRRTDEPIRPANAMRIGDTGAALEVRGTFAMGDASGILLSAPGLRVEYDSETGVVRVQDKASQARRKVTELVIHLLLDVSSVEVVFGDGEMYVIAERSYSQVEPGSPLEISVPRGSARVIDLEAFRLAPIF